MLQESDDLDVLGVTFDAKLTFEKHLRSVSRAASGGGGGDGDGGGGGGGDGGGSGGGDFGREECFHDLFMGFPLEVGCLNRFLTGRVGTFWSRNAPVLLY